MKVSITLFSLMLFVQSSAYAADVKKPVTQTATVTIGNITITNKSETDIAYRVSGQFPGFAYGVKAGESDVYVFKGSDTYQSRFETAECYKMDGTGAACLEYGEFQPCMIDTYGGFKRYNFVDLLSSTSCDFVHAYNW